MADVKWSSNASFVPQISLGSLDQIMGLTSGNVNAKYPASLFALNAAVVHNTGTESIAGNKTFTGNTGFSDSVTIATTKSLFVDNIVGTGLSLKLNPSTSGQAVYIAHDLAVASAEIGTGSTQTTFVVRNSASVKFQVANSGAVTTLNNTLDDGSGNSTFAGTMSTNNVSVNGYYTEVLDVGIPAIPGTISATILTNGIITLNTATPGQTETFDTSANIYAALGGNLPQGSGFRTKMVNTGNQSIQLAPAADMLFNGMPSTTIAAGQTMDLIGWLSQTSPPVYIFYGGTNLGAYVYTAGSGLTLAGNSFSVTTGGITNAMLAGSIDQSKVTNLVANLAAKIGGTETSTVLIAGVGAAPNITTGSTQEIVCIGPLAGSAVPNSPSNASRSMFIGYNCGAAYTTSGSPNDNHLGVGYFALRNMTTAFGNTAVGSQSLLSLTTSSENTVIGSSSASNLKTGGGQNVVIGNGCGAGASNASYTKNTLMGYTAASALDTSSEIVAIGYNAAPAITTGNSNTVIGASSASTLSTGSNNTLIGANATVTSSSAANRIAIGQGASSANDNQAVIGNSSTTSIVSNGATATLGTTALPFANVCARIPITVDTTTARTLSSVDLYGYITTTNGSTVTITVPTGVYSVGDYTMFYTGGAGQISFVASGTTINSKLSNLKTNTMGSPAMLICVAVNNFQLIGDLSV